MGAALALAIPLGCGETASDPDTARCNAPSPSFSAIQVAGDHNEVSVRFACEGVRLSGTTGDAASGRAVLDDVRRY